jgi:hypothetical protein
MSQAVRSLVARLVLLALLVGAIAVLSVAFGRELLGLPPRGASPSPSRPVAATATAGTSSPSANASASATAAATPTASCPPVAPGGRQSGLHSLRDLRVAHQPGFDRVVFDFGQEAGASDDLPAFRIERASSFTSISGQPVAVQGSAFWRVRFEGASIADQSGRLVYAGSRDIVPTTPLVREVKEVEDFEAVMIWAIGLARLECPVVMTLRSPLRLVVDLPTPGF